MAYGQRQHVESFYHLQNADISRSYCRCLACFVGRNLDKDRYQKALVQKHRIYNLGRAFDAPEAGADAGRPHIGIKSPHAIVLERIKNGGAKTLAGYRAQKGYLGLEKALAMSGEEIIGELERTGLRGRGGAGFDTGAKWRALSRQKSPLKYIVANADEGDPGAYIDRFILEDDPFCVIEALTIAGYALKARCGIIFLRKEYAEAEDALVGALKEARDASLLGNDIGGLGFNFDLRVEMGRGSYLCGEESSLLNALEEKRAEARARPPYPYEKGLFGFPTLVNNIETLANIPWIIRNGSDSFRALGFSQSRGTKCVSLNSLFNRPGLYEVEFGLLVRDIVQDLGCGLKAGELKGLIIGGPLAGVIPPELLDTPFGFEELKAIGASVGHGGVIAFNHDTSIAELMHHVFEFGSFESCGKCTPCRVGTNEIEEHFLGAKTKDKILKCSYEKMDRLIDALKLTSLCGHGSGLADFALSIKRYYGAEYEKCFW